MNRISVIYTIKYELDFAPEYVWTECKKCFNTKTGRQLKQSYVSGSIGYSIRGKFHSLSSLRKHLQRPKKQLCQF